MKNELMSEIMKMTGMDKIVKGVKDKFASKEWILVERSKKKVEVYSIVNAETVTILDEKILQSAYDEDGNLLSPNDSISMWLALRLLSARDGKDHELTPAGIKIRKWIKTLSIDSDVIDGSCVDKYLQEKGIDSSENE